MKELGKEEVLTFSLISSNQLRTVGNIHTFISMTLMSQTSLLLIKNNFIFKRKCLILLSPWLRWTQTGGGGKMQTRGRNEDDSGVSVASSSLSSSSDSSEISSSSSGSSAGSKTELFQPGSRLKNITGQELLIRSSLDPASMLLILLPSDSIASNPDLGSCWRVVTVKAERVCWSDEKVGPLVGSSASNFSIFSAPDE